MSNDEFDDLEQALRRSGDPIDRQVADLLDGLALSGRAPRANDALAAFLVDAELSHAPLTDLTVPEPSTTDHVVVLGPTPRSNPMRSKSLVPLQRVLKMGVLAKVMLGATVAFTGAGVAASNGAFSPSDGARDTVVVVPASDGVNGSSGTDVLGGTEIEDETGIGHGLDLDDGPNPDEDADDPADNNEGEDQQGQHEDANDNQGEDQQGQHEDANDDQGEDQQGQHEDANDDQGEDQQGQHEDANDDQGEDQQGQHEDANDDQGEDQQGQHEDANDDQGEDQQGQHEDGDHGGEDD